MVIKSFVHTYDILFATLIVCHMHNFIILDCITIITENVLFLHHHHKN